MAVSIRPVWLCKPYPPPDGTGHIILAGGIEPPISRISAGCTHRCTTPGDIFIKHSGRNSNPQLLLRRQAICPVNRPEYEQGLPGSNRRLRFWRPLCFQLHQAPLNIPDRAHEIQWISVLRRSTTSGGRWSWTDRNGVETRRRIWPAKP